MTGFIGANISKVYTAGEVTGTGVQYGDAPGAGDVYETNDGKRYRFVLFDKGAGSVAAVAGKAAYLFATGGQSTGAMQTVTMDLTDALNSLAAVIAGVFQSVPSDTNYCWIQTWGVCTVLTAALVSGKDGMVICGPTSGGTDGSFLHLEVGITSGAVVVDEKVAAGYIIDGSAGLVYLRCS